MSQMCVECNVVEDRKEVCSIGKENVKEVHSSFRDHQKVKICIKLQEGQCSNARILY